MITNMNSPVETTAATKPSTVPIKPTTVSPKPNTTLPTTTRLTLVPTQSTTTTTKPSKSSATFYLSPAKANWFGANVYCQRNNSRLVVLNSAEMQKELEEFLDQHNLRNQPFWTAGNQLIDMKTWHWGIDGPLIEYTHWSKGQPDNYKNSQHCIKLFAKSFQWDDDNCERILDF
ncbi:PREDICTED: C-type lectin 37Da-like, partial [Rhagoletis zephyria]|uniref:C-type lectin 37Da-like n=1 Tax=Rhagoletis zephyria TaxID=28612 RepID=UPI00081128A7